MPDKMETSSWARQVTCNVCSVSMTAGALSQHKKTHADNKEDLMYRCAFPGCSMRSLKKFGVVKHHLAHHTDICAFACKIEFVDENDDKTPCPFVAQTPSKLLFHRLNQHGEVMAAAKRAKRKTLPRADFGAYLHDAYVLPPLARMRCVNRDRTAAGKPDVGEEHDAPHAREPLKISKSINTRNICDPRESVDTGNLVNARSPVAILAKVDSAVQTTRATTREGLSNLLGETDHIPVPSPRPTLVPLEELERIHLERFGYPAGCPEQLRVPQVAANEIVIAPLVMDGPKNALHSQYRERWISGL